MSFSIKVLLGLIGGGAVGLLFGEAAAWLGIAGDAFIGLLQMAVLPYIVGALVLNLGRLSLARSRKLGLHALTVFAGLWVVGVVTLLLLTLCLPDRESGSFFSASLIETHDDFDFVGLYIPTNPFSAMAAGIVPAVVVFSVTLGIALMVQKNKDTFLDSLDVLVKALSKLNGAVVKLTPIGVFAIAGHAAGTMTLDQVGRLQAYLIVATAGVAVLSFWVLPMLVAALTPLSYRDVIRAGRDAALTAFATGKVFVVLPMLAKSSHDLLATHEAGDHPDEYATDALVPLAFPFPKLGAIVVLVFVPFSAWFMGRTIPLADYPTFITAGLLSCFGNPVIIVPFLLDLMHLPVDMFQLFVIATILSDRVRNALNAMFLLAFTLLTGSSLRGLLRVQPRRLMVLAIGTAVLMLITIVGTRTYLNAFFAGEFTKADFLAQMHVPRTPREAVELAEAKPNPVPLREGLSRLERARQRKALRVGYVPDQLPWAFRNGRKELVGFDIEMAYRLADDLKVTLELVPLDADDLAGHLEQDHCDLIMAGIAKTIERAQEMELSEPYLDITLAVIARDHRLRELATIDLIREQPGLKIAVSTDGIFGELLAEAVADGRIPNFEVTEVDSYRSFFEAEEGAFDLLVASAQGGSAWTVLHPEFSVANPLPHALSVPMVYPLAGPRIEPLHGFVGHWLSLRRRDGTIDRLSDYWIHGRQQGETAPRWCILRDVLGWMK